MDVMVKSSAGHDGAVAVGERWMRNSDKVAGRVSAVQTRRGVTAVDWDADDPDGVVAPMTRLLAGDLPVRYTKLG